MRRRVALLIATTACGRLSFDDQPSPHDACVFGGFGAPRALDEINSVSDDWGPWLSEDKLELLFGSGRSGVQRLYRSRRVAADALFEAPQLIDLLAIGGDDPFVTDDGLVLYFNAGNSGQIDPYRATRMDRTIEFANPTLIPELASATDDATMSVTADDQMIVFSSRRTGGAGFWDLYTSQRASRSDPFDPPMLLSSIDRAGLESGGTLNADGSAMVFASDQLSPGTQHVLATIRRDGVFLPPTVLDPALVGSREDADPQLTRDGTTIVFASNRAVGTGWDVYLAERSCLDHGQLR